MACSTLNKVRGKRHGTQRAESSIDHWVLNIRMAQSPWKASHFSTIEPLVMSAYGAVAVELGACVSMDDNIWGFRSDSSDSGKRAKYAILLKVGRSWPFKRWALSVRSEL